MWENKLEQISLNKFADVLIFIHFDISANIWCNSRDFNKQNVKNFGWRV